MPSTNKPKTVTEYINAAPKETKKKLSEMRACLRAVSPKATESLKWSTPAFSYERILFTYAGFKKHIGFYPTPNAVKAFARELKAKGLKTAKGSIQFPLDKPLPSALIKKIAKFRIKELKEKDVRWM